ncbi:MAG: hypothetical protein Q4G66_10165 [bacterium]|nr:hypothetical protein [bacterium]
MKLKCPKCSGIIDLGKAAPATAPAPAQPPPAGQGTAATVQPPPPPPLDWLSDGEMIDSGKVEDVPMALVLWPAGENRDSIEKTLKTLGYQLLCTDNLQEAQERMRFVRFACIVYQAEMHGGLEASPFHAAMCAMSMEHRRHIFYILTGDSLHTLYDLEALAVSANLTVRSKDIPKLHVVLRKAFQAHEELFGPFLEELGIHSKS